MGWGEALSGLGAGLSGNGPQWQVAHAAQKESLAKLDEQRRQALLEDFRGTLIDLKSGNIEQASARLQDRLGAIEKLGGDPTHTAEINRMIREGRVDEAIQGLQGIDDRAVAAGKLPSMADKHLGNKSGQDIFQRADGSVYAKPTEGWSAEMAAASGGGSAASLGMTRLFKDETGNLFYGANIFDKTTGQMRVDMVPTSGDPNTKPSGSVMPVDPYGNNAAERVGQKAAESQAGESGKLSAQLSQKPEVEADIATAVEAAKGKILTAARKKDTDTLFNAYNSARTSVEAALADTSLTGPVAGNLPAVTSAAQTAAGNIMIYSYAIKGLVRSAGEGNWSDADQRALQSMLPSRTDTPDAASAKMGAIDAWVRAKLGQPPAGGQQPTSTAATPSGDVAVPDSIDNARPTVKFLGFE